MITIEKDGKTVSESKNLRGVRDYENTRYTYVISLAVTRFHSGKGGLVVCWADGARCETNFESYAVLVNWLTKRRSWYGLPIEATVTDETGLAVIGAANGELSKSFNAFCA